MSVDCSRICPNVLVYIGWDKIYLELVFYHVLPSRAPHYAFKIVEDKQVPPPSIPAPLEIQIITVCLYQVIALPCPFYDQQLDLGVYD